MAGGDSLRNLQRLVDGYVEAQHHTELSAWCNDEGRLIDLPINPRFDHWLLNDSQAGKRGAVSERVMVYGDVVLTGPPDEEGDLTPIDQLTVSYFRTLKIDQDAMRDWDVRSTEVVITDWSGEGLGF